MNSRLIVVALMLVASPALAEDAPPAPKPAPEKKICRSIVPTGSIMGKRICLTKTEWKEFDQLNQDSAEGALNRRRGGMPRDGD